MTSAAKQYSGCHVKMWNVELQFHILTLEGRNNVSEEKKTAAVYKTRPLIIEKL